MPHTDTDPRIAYEVAGDGSPVLLVMGLGMAGAAWLPQVEALRGRHACCTFDHPGIGASAPGPALPTMQTLSAGAIAVLDALGWPSAHVVGVSMGGMVAQELALTAPDRVRSLALIATHAGGPLRLPTREGLRLFARANTARRGDRIHALQELLYPAEYLASLDREALTSRMTSHIGPRADGRTLLGQLHAITRHSTATRLARLRVPTLLVRPGRDVLVRPTETDRLAQLLPHARLLRFDEAGHGVTFQMAQALNEALLSHFAEAEAPQ
jgi:pimeloyl-ACP methyl ester carboxylesterase